MDVILFIQGTFAKVFQWCRNTSLFGTNILYILLAFWVVKKIIKWFMNEEQEIKSYERRRK